jgi:hypothetical protein
MKRANGLFVMIAAWVATDCGGTSTKNSQGSDAGARVDSGASEDATVGSDAADGEAASEASIAADDANAQGDGGDSGLRSGKPCKGPPACSTPEPVCCATAFAGRQWLCATTRDACPSGWDAYGCMGPDGCGAGETCCQIAGGSRGDNPATACLGSCNPLWRVCHTSSDCPSAWDCVPRIRSSDVDYSVCSPSADAGLGPADAGPLAQVYLNAMLTNVGDSTTCLLATGTSGVTLGAFPPDAAAPDPLAEGQTGIYFVRCTVAASGDGFDVNLSANVGTNSNATSGFVWITGHVNSAGGQGLSATFDGYAARDSCTVTPASSTTNGAALVAAGRIWGHISCPMISLNGTVCDAEADFLFQNCE